MVFGSDTSKQIVRTWAGQGTGQTVYETEDGRRWVTPAQRPTCQGTAPTWSYGTIVGNRIYPD